VINFKIIFIFVLENEILSFFLSSLVRFGFNNRSVPCDSVFFIKFLALTEIRGGTHMRKSVPAIETLGTY